MSGGRAGAPDFDCATTSLFWVYSGWVVASSGEGVDSCLKNPGLELIVIGLQPTAGLEANASARWRPLLAAGLVAPAFAGPSREFPKYVAGPGSNGKYVLGNGQIVSPAGMRISLGPQARAKAIAINPVDGHTASVLLLGASQAVEVFDTKTGAILQQYSSSGGTDSSGSYSGTA